MAKPNRFDFLKEKFNDLVNKHDLGDTANKLTKSAAAAGQAFADSLRKEFPKENVAGFVNDVYAMIGSAEIANTISNSLTTMSRDDVKNALDNVVNSLTDEKTATQLAKKLKELSTQHSFDEFKAQFDVLAEKLPMQHQMIYSTAMTMFEPFYNNMKYMDEAEIAQNIQNLGSVIPTDQVADQIHQVVMNITPERITMMTQQVLEKAPSGDMIAEVAHAAAESLSKNLVNVVKDKNYKVDDLAQNVMQDVQDALRKASNDNQQKPTIRKGKDGGGFNLP